MTWITALERLERTCCSEQTLAVRRTAFHPLCLQPIAALLTGVTEVGGGGGRGLVRLQNTAR